MYLCCTYAVPLNMLATHGSYHLACRCTQDGRLNRLEFVALCSEVLWHVPEALIETAAANVAVARSSRKKRNRVYWSAKAQLCDRWARASIPSACGLHSRLSNHAPMAMGQRPPQSRCLSSACRPPFTHSSTLLRFYY